MATYPITAYKENDFSIGTLLQTKFVEAGMSAAGASIVKTLSDNLETYFSVLGYSYWVQAENIASACEYLGAYVNIKSQSLMKYALLFSDAPVISLHKISDDATTETRNLTKSGTRGLTITGDTENAPIGDNIADPINTPNVKTNSGESETNGGTDTGTVTTTHNFSEHDPIEDLKYLQEAKNTMQDILYSFIRSFILEFNSVL